MGVYIKGLGMPTECYGLRLIIYPNGQVLIPRSTYWEEPNGVEAIPVPDHGRLIDADEIGLTDFEIIMCQKGNPFKNALEMLFDKIEKMPTIIPADEEAP